MEVEEYSWANGGTRNDFQGQEKDEELWGGSSNYKYRMNDPRIGRFFAEDPLRADFPWNSPYAFSENRLIDAIELEGAERLLAIDKKNASGGSDLEITLLTDYETVLKARELVKNLQSKGQITWINRQTQLQYIYAANDMYDDIYAGTISLHQKEDGTYTAYFDNYLDDRRRELERLEYEAAIPSIILDGVVDIGVGVTAVVTAVYEEGATLGAATPLVITQVAFGLDEIAGGVNKIIDPKSAYEGQETKPIKYFVGKFLGEGGNFVYNTIDLAIGFNDIKKADGLIDLVGIYDTANDADAALVELNESLKK